MGFLQRSKSAAAPAHPKRKKESHPPLPGQVPAAVSTEEKRSTSFERPKTADASFSRPRTANAAIGRTMSDWSRPSFKIDIKAENEVFSFPMPSPLVQPPDSPVVKKRPSPLQELGSPAIGVAIGSPSQAPTHTRPTWGRSVTADSVSPRMPSQPPPTRPPPAIPSQLDLDILSNDSLKKRKSGWKSLGGLFCRRQTIVQVEEPTYRLKMPNAIEERDIIIPVLAELAEYGSTPTYGPRRSSLLPPPQAALEVERATLKPSGLTIVTRSTSSIPKDSFSPMFRTINGIPEDGVWVDDPRKDSPLSITSPQSFRLEEKPPGDPHAPQLAILDLPDPKFERYSIMFEKLLLESSGPSLLERRQSKLQRNRSVKKLDLFPPTDKRQEIPRLEINGVPEPSPRGLAKSQSLSSRIGKKMLSPVTEAFTALNRPHPIRRSKTAPTLSISPRSPNFPTSPTSLCGTECSLPPTPMTFTTISDSGSVEIIEIDSEPVRRSMQTVEPSWDMVPQPLRVKPAEKRVAHVSVARQVSVSQSVEKVVRESSEGVVGGRQPLRARMVELGKNRTSTAVLIEIAEE